MDKTPAYMVLESNSAQGLMAEVNRHIKQGYIPQGGVSVMMIREGMFSVNLYAQAMIKTS
jgi:hypothetical protein